MRPDPLVASGTIGLNAIQRRVSRVVRSYTYPGTYLKAYLKAWTSVRRSFSQGPHLDSGRVALGCATARPQDCTADATCRLPARLPACLQIIRVSSGDRCTAVPFEPPHSAFQIVLLNAEVDFVAKKAVRGPDVEIDAQILSGHIQTRFMDQVGRCTPHGKNRVVFTELGWLGGYCWVGVRRWGAALPQPVA